MNKKAKILTTSILLVSVMALGGKVVFGANSDSPLGVNDVISNVVGNNSDLTLYKDKVRVKEEWYNHEEKIRKNDSNYDTDVKRDVLPLKEEAELSNLNWEREHIQDKIIVEAKELYYKSLIQNRMIDVQQKTVERQIGRAHV